MRRAILLSLAVTLIGGIFVSSQVSAVATPQIVSIGDSVAAGSGLPTKSGTQNQLCQRSSQAYPYIVASSLHMSLLHIPCAGAKVNDGVYGEQERSGTVKSPQLDRAFQYGTPKYIIGTVGANDMRWISFIQQCYVYTCGSKLDSARMVAYRTDLRYELSRMVYEIRKRSNDTAPQVILSGYYLPFTDTSCIKSAQTSGVITTSEQQWVADQTSKMNDAIKSVADLFRGVDYVPVSFAGHEACSSDPWVQGMDAAAPLHPTAQGQRAIAQSFLSDMRH